MPKSIWSPSRGSSAQTLPQALGAQPTVGTAARLPGLVPILEQATGVPSLGAPRHLLSLNIP